MIELISCSSFARMFIVRFNQFLAAMNTERTTITNRVRMLCGPEIFHCPKANLATQNARLNQAAFSDAIR